MRSHFQAMSDLIYHAGSLTEAEQSAKAEQLINELLVGKRAFIEDWSDAEKELKSLMQVLQNVYLKTCSHSTAPHVGDPDVDRAEILGKVKREAAAWSYSSDDSEVRALLPLLTG